MNGSLTSLVKKQCNKKKKLVSWVESRINVAGKSLVVHAYSACIYYLGIKLQFREIFCLVCFPSKRALLRMLLLVMLLTFAELLGRLSLAIVFIVFLGAFNATMYHVFICTCYRAFFLHIFSLIYWCNDEFSPPPLFKPLFIVCHDTCNKFLLQGKQESHRHGSLC